MPQESFDRGRIRCLPLAARRNTLRIAEIAVPPEQPPRPLNAAARAAMDVIVERVRAARAAGRPVILAFGAHAIKNGLAPVLIRLMERGWLTHLATN